MVDVVIVDLYSPHRHLWCWLQWQTERELRDLFATTEIRYDSAGFDLLARHTERVYEPFGAVLWPDRLY